MAINLNVSLKRNSLFHNIIVEINRNNMRRSDNNSMRRISLHRLHLFNPLYNNGISRNLYQLKIDGWLNVNDATMKTAFIFHVSTNYTEHWTLNSEHCCIRCFRHWKHKVLAFPLFVFFFFSCVNKCFAIGFRVGAHPALEVNISKRFPIRECLSN